MTYDSPFWAIEGEVIPEVANFKEEGLVTPEGWEGEKEILKICWSMQGIEPGSHVKCQSADHYTTQRCVLPVSFPVDLLLP